MKKILILISFFSFLRSDSLYTYNDIETGQTVEICIVSYFTDSNNSCSMMGSNGYSYFGYGSCSSLNISSGYSYSDGVCSLASSSSSSDAEQLGLSEEHYNVMMALVANALGFTLVFLVGFLFVLQGRR